MKRSRGSSFMLAAVLVAGGAHAATVPPTDRGEDVYLSGPEIDVTDPVPGDLVAAGGNVRVRGPVLGNAVVAGGQVTLDGPVTGDVFAAAGEVVLRGRSRDDARLAGGSVRVEGTVDGDVVAAGGKVRIDRDAVVGERARLAGGEVVVAGTIKRNLRAAGGKVSIAGTVEGDVDVTAETLEIGPSARIEGTVLHHGPEEPRIDPGARIGGRVDHQRAPGSGGIGVLGFTIVVAALFATGAAMILLFPRFAPGAARTVETDPWRALGIGALVLFGAPAAAIALAVTVVGIPLGAVLIAAWIVALLAGYLVAALLLGTFGARRLGRPAASRGGLVLALLAALVVLRVLRLVPVLGGLVSLAALLFGTGALVLCAYRAYRGRPAETVSAG